MATTKRVQDYEQLPSVRLGADYAWIAGAIEKQSEGRADAVRGILREVLGKSGSRVLDVRHMDKTQGTVETIPPTRLLAGYEHLPKAIANTKAWAEKRIGYPLDNADVIRAALWDGLAARGFKTPKKPIDIYAEVLRLQHKTKTEIASELGVSRDAVTWALRRVGAVQDAKKGLTSAELRVIMDKRLSQQEAADRIGMSQKTVSKARARLGYEAPPERAKHANRYTDEQKAVALRNDLPLKEIMRRTGMSFGLVTKLRAEAGVSQPAERATDKQRAIVLRRDLSYSEAIRLSGLSQTTVWRIRHKAGMTEAAEPVTDKQRAIALREDLTYAEAAELSGLGLSTIGAIRRESGVTRPHNDVTPKALAIALRTDLTYAEAAKKSGLSPVTIGRLRREAGLTRSRKK